MGTRRAAVVGVTFAALMLGLVPAATFAATRTHQARPRPDAAIRFVGVTSDFGDYAVKGRWVGLHLRSSSAADQTLTRRFAGAAPRGTHYVFEVKITNHGAAGRLMVKSATQPSSRVDYRASGRDVTAAVVTGTFRTPVLAKGQSFVMRISAGLKPGTSAMQRLVVVADGSSQVLDSVRLNVHYLACGC